MGANIIMGVLLLSSPFLAALGDRGLGYTITLDSWRGLLIPPVVILYIFLGCIMETLAMMLLTIPILLPLVLQLGFDTVWFGIMIVIVVKMGMISPPVGMNVFVIKGIAPDVPALSIFKGILPFLLVDIVLIALFTAFPEIILWLPQVLS